MRYFTRLPLSGLIVSLALGIDFVCNGPAFYYFKEFAWRRMS